jgi:hypothetical protein
VVLSSISSSAVQLARKYWSPPISMVSSLGSTSGVIVFNHVTAVFANDLLSVKSLPIGLAHMSLVIDQAEDGNSNSITYLYKWVSPHGQSGERC